MILIPAYGRSYNTIQDALQDWNDGKDFRISAGPYTSIRDLALLKKDFTFIEIWTDPGGRDRYVIYDNDPLAKYINTSFTTESPC